MLTDKEKKQMALYETQLGMPKWKYVLVYGVLAWGLTVAVLVSVFQVLINQVPLQRMLRKELWINLITFPIAGIFFGLFMRGFLARQIKRLKGKEMEG